MAKRNEYWGVYDTGIAATPKGPKKLIEEMAGMLSGSGRSVCIQKAEPGLPGALTGVCYVNGVRERKRRRATAPVLAAPTIPEKSDG